jgi:putative transcriptional regulator
VRDAVVRLCFCPLVTLARNILLNWTSPLGCKDNCSNFGNILRISREVRNSRRCRSGIGNIFQKGLLVEDVVAIGASIRRARKDAGITQATLADLIGTSSRTVHAIETGRGNPSLVTVAAAANAVGLHLKAIDD